VGVKGGIMNSNDRFNVVFTGLLVQGVSLDVAKQNFKQAFALDQTRLDAFFTGKTVVFKKNVDTTEAMKIRGQLKRLGLISSLEAFSETVPGTVNTASPVADTQRQQEAAISVTSFGSQQSVQNMASVPNWSIAPAGSDLEQLKVERPPVVVDISAMTLAPVGTDILTPKVSATKVPAIDISKLSLVKE
jgi:hypothetical protein